MSDLVTMPMGTSRSLTTGMRWHLCFSIMPATEATVARWRQVRGGLDITSSTVYPLRFPTFSRSFIDNTPTQVPVSGSTTGTPCRYGHGRRRLFSERYVKKQANTHPVALHGRRHDGVLEGQARGERARRAGHDISDVAVRVHDGSLVDRATSSSWVMAAESGFVLCRETPGGPLRGEAPVAGGARAELTRGDAGGREGFE